VEINEISGAVVDSTMKVHSRLGPGLLEQPYKKCLQHELTSRGFQELATKYQLPIKIG
jgi:GxxExxY protein